MSGRAETARGDGGEAVRVDSAKLASSDLTSFGPPPELTPAQGGIVLAEGVKDEHEVAWLISAAVDGYLDIKGSEEYPTLVRRTPAVASPPDPSTVAVLDQAFGGGKRLTLGGFNPRFAAARRLLSSQLADWRRTCGLWDPAGDRRCRRARLLGVIAAPLGLAMTFLGGMAVVRADWAWRAIVVLGAVVAGAGLALVIRAWELRVRTSRGSARWLQVESFRRLLAKSGAPQADEATQGGHLGQYTAWAVALGEVDRWSRAVAASTVASSSHLPRPMCDPRMARALSLAMSASITPPSSSGGSGWYVDVGGGRHGRFGGGGGGGDGGGNGGGGGGGGSW
jgi:hypothetical protein